MGGETKVPITAAKHRSSCSSVLAVVRGSHVNLVPHLLSKLPPMPGAHMQGRWRRAGARRCRLNTPEMCQVSVTFLMVIKSWSHSRWDHRWLEHGTPRRTPFQRLASICLGLPLMIQLCGTVSSWIQLKPPGNCFSFLSCMKFNSSKKHFWKLPYKPIPRSMEPKPRAWGISINSFKSLSWPQYASLVKITVDDGGENIPHFLSVPVTRIHTSFCSRNPIAQTLLPHFLG